MRLAHQNHARLRHHANQPRERTQRFRNPLIRLQKTENPDQRRSLVQP